MRIRKTTTTPTLPHKKINNVRSIFMCAGSNADGWTAFYFLGQIAYEKQKLVTTEDCFSLLSETRQLILCVLNIANQYVKTPM